jgi:hypothetical protein
LPSARVVHEFMEATIHTANNIPRLISEMCFIFLVNNRHFHAAGSRIILWAVVFWIVTPCDLTGGYRRFERHKLPSTLKMDTVCSSETLVTTYRTMRCLNPDHISTDMKPSNIISYSYCWALEHTRNADQSLALQGGLETLCRAGTVCINNTTLAKFPFFIRI